MDRDFGLTVEQRDLIAAFRAYVADRIRPEIAGFEERGEFPRDHFRDLCAMGLGGIPYEERYGGGGQPYLLYLAVLEEVATGSLSLAVGRTGQEGPQGISAFALEKGWPGLDFGAKETKMGWHASPMREVLLDGCRVPGDNLVGEEGQG